VERTGTGQFALPAHVLASLPGGRPQNRFKAPGEGHGEELAPR
jgi:hypothetical protein